MAPARREQDKDPVIEEYDIFITESPIEDVYVLQYPIRDRQRPFNRRHGATPIEMRLKPESKFIEVDVAMNPHVNFNRAQGMAWGESMQKAAYSGLTTFGAATGFGPGAIKPRLDASANSRVANQEVFQKQTIGGQIQAPLDGRPQYMLGTFRDKELHLTRVDGIAQMRPQFHHLDAQSHIDRASAHREADDARSQQPRGVTQSYTTLGKDDKAKGDDKNLMLKAQEEKWTRLNYFDEEDAEAYEIYQKLFVKDTNNSEQLVSSMTNEEYLDAISAPRHDPSGRRKKKPLTRKQRVEIELADDHIEGLDEEHGGVPLEEDHE